MDGLPEFLKVPEGTEKLPPLHKATAFLNPTDYLSEYALTVTNFDLGTILVPPPDMVKALGHAILTDKESNLLCLCTCRSTVMKMSTIHRGWQLYGIEKGAVHELKPSPFTSSIRVWSSVRILILPSTSQPLRFAYTHFIPQAYLGPPLDPGREPVLDSASTGASGTVDRKLPGASGKPSGVDSARRAKVARAGGSPAHALELFDNLLWTGDVKGLMAGGSISDLALWFTADWLITDHEDGMLKMLADDLRLSDGSKDSVQPTYFAHGLAQAYMNPNTYCTAHQFQWLRRLGEAFATKDCRCLGTMKGFALVCLQLEYY
ncbi:hypothetical protein DFH08DRAFT_797985 [Mycena albidolilacea]|uniref:Uncharacterized protein n=1 Tax=Mycena albidolilacea TaxID=1033008 RepID=A0AAD7ASI7_9AGAR|nr:hypothetical protein DFH08DRAFT_797985 [Mycena albidolilacea]